MIKRRVSPEEEHLLAHAMKDVKPATRRAAKKAAPAAAAATKASKITVKAAPARSVEKPKPQTLPLATVDKRTEQKLKRGRLEIGATIDLHGLKQADAHRNLLRFIGRAAEAEHKAVLVITGKGNTPRKGDHDALMPSDRRGVLKAQVPLWLEEPGLRPYVLSFKSAGPRHGGTGALYVLLRKQKKR